jgi:hypothetical protein
LSASIVPEPQDGSHHPQPLVTSIDIDPSALVHPGVPWADRALAAISYFGVFPLIVLAGKPRSSFVRRHLRLALGLFMARVVWAGAVLALWWRLGAEQAGEYGLLDLLRDFVLLALAGLPWQSTLRSDALPWILTPVLITGMLGAAGMLLAARGRTADFMAFVNADWADPVTRRTFLGVSPEEEKQLARRARERQIERLQKSSNMMRTEQARRDKISSFEGQLERINLQREYHDQLLALGEISQRRYEQVNADLDEQAAYLRSQLSGLETRVQSAHAEGSERTQFNRLRRPSETLVESIAIVTPAGVPIFTYGQFQLDDAIVAGMLSAFDSLSEEVFGSRVNKTALAEGQVLHFAHGDYVLIMASFTDEPSPRQIEDLRTMLKQFEAANEGPIARGQYDPKHLHEVPIPFRFAERMPRREAALPDGH